jgi:hypothetical protein
LALLCVAVVPALVVLLIGTAVGFSGFSLSIQQTGQFELDGNAIQDHGTPPPFSAPFDWDAVFAQCPTPTSAGCSENPGTQDGASVRAFITDPFNSGSDSIFTGGGSKDISGMSSWAWKTASVQGKDDIEHAYAVEYQKVHECDPSNPTNCADHQLLFFGSDRYSNAGDANYGFWFLKGKITLTGTGSGSGSPFGGHHSDGDVFVVSAFQNGGTVPIFAVYTWSCPGLAGAACDTNGSLQPVPGTSNGAAGCVAGTDSKGNPTVAFTGPYCATTNKTQINSPWPYMEKPADGGTAPNKFGPQTFFEGGLDTTALGLDRDCFSSFLAETRASQTPNATLSDLALGTFAVCSATVTTTPSTTATVTPGTSVTDTATVTGKGLPNPPFPTSSTTTGDPGAPGTLVTFTLCGPDSATTCQTLAASGTPPAGTLSPTSTQGVSSATSASVAPTVPGKYCFHASWGGDANYDRGPYTETNSAQECFTVATLPTTTVTTPGNKSDGTGPFTQSNPPKLGDSAYDTAIVTAFKDQAAITSNTPYGGAGAPTGTVTFYVCSPAVLAAANATTCSKTIGTAVGSPVTLTDLGATPPDGVAHSQSSATSSPGVLLDTAGNWCFAGYYTPTGTTFDSAGSQDTSTTECFTVPTVPTKTVTTPQDGSGATLKTDPPTLLTPTNPTVTAYDQAVVTGVKGAGNPTGSVDFSICGPVTTGTCDASANTPFDTEQSKTPSGTFGTDSSGNPTWTVKTLTGTTISVPGTYCFFAKYTPTNSNYDSTGSSDGGTTECFTVHDQANSSSTQQWVPSDTGTVTAAAGTSLTGTLTFTLYPDADCNKAGTDSAQFSESFSLSGASSPTSVPTGGPNPANVTGPTGVTGSVPTVTSTSSLNWSWLVQYSSSDPLVENGSNAAHCEHTTFTAIAN